MRELILRVGKIMIGLRTGLPCAALTPNARASRALIADLASREDYLLADIGIERHDLEKMEGRSDASRALQELALLRNAAAAAYIPAEPGEQAARGEYRLAA